MTDRILTASLDANYERARALADASDLLEIQRLDQQRFAARFHSKVLVRGTDGEVREEVGFDVGYWFPSDYLRRVEALRIITWIRPQSVFHPNIRFPVCCIGHIAPGTPLIDLLYRTYEVVSYQNNYPDERDALNPTACQWARNNQRRFPLDARPLKRRPCDAQRAALDLPASSESTR